MCHIFASATVLEMYKEWEKSNSGSRWVRWIDHTHDLKSLLQYGERVVHWMDLLSRFLLFSPDTGSFISVPGTSLSTFSAPMHKMSIAVLEVFFSDICVLLDILCISLTGAESC